MCHLLSDSTPQVQIMAYQFLQRATRRRTEYLVIEAGVDTESAVKVELPSELIALLQRDLELRNDSERDEQVCEKTVSVVSLIRKKCRLFQYILCWLLGWLLTFDSFENAVCWFPYHFASSHIFFFAVCKSQIGIY
jgi:E3 ubiquitin-protein ligase listerin